MGFFPHILLRRKIFLNLQQMIARWPGYCCVFPYKLTHGRGKATTLRDPKLNRDLLWCWGGCGHILWANRRVKNWTNWELCILKTRVWGRTTVSGVCCMVFPPVFLQSLSVVIAAFLQMPWDNNQVDTIFLHCLLIGKRFSKMELSFL